MTTGCTAARSRRLPHHQERRAREGHDPLEKRAARPDIQVLASYILSLQGTDPANGKEPAGRTLHRTAESINDPCRTYSPRRKLPRYHRHGGRRGKRQWVFPKRPAGRFYRCALTSATACWLMLFGLPWIRVGGEPIFLFNVLERHFILFGLHFTPQDFHLFALLMVTGMVFIILFTAVFGRLFCGWVCPQTIFMEMVFRKIEYWIEGDANAQKRLAKAPWTRDKVRQESSQHGSSSSWPPSSPIPSWPTLSALTACWRSSPLAPPPSPGGLLAIVVFIGVFYAVFAYMREQVCTAICPYGRLQGVLLDDDSVNVIYDYGRGEPRGKIEPGKPKRTTAPAVPSCRENRSACTDRILESIRPLIARDYPPPPKGDCIDCRLCVQVCPTGHRHPQRHPDGVHQLHGLHRRLRHGHGQGRPAAGTDPLR